MDLISARNLPAQPRSIEETGLSQGLLTELVLKMMYTRGFLFGHEIADGLKLPFANIIDKVLDTLRHEYLIEVKSSAGISSATYEYVVTNQGRARAREAMEQNTYVGPAPVPLAAYTKMVKAQSLAGQTVSQDELKSALAHLVLNATIIDQLGAGINAGRAIFLFGNTGDGKTSIGLAIGALLPGTIWIPYAIGVDRQIIKVFDAIHHRAISEVSDDASLTARKGLLSYLSREQSADDSMLGMRKGERYDERWVLIRRPLIVVGGELTLKNLNPVFDPKTKYYEAPQPMKANGGVFLMDDLGRQPVSPREILNRWIVPLEKHVDYLTLAMGYKVDVPFDALVVFATNLNPEDLVDESFLRRIRYKIHVTDPTWEEFREIFTREAAKRKIQFGEESLRYLTEEYYTKSGRKPRGVHPRDILEALIDIARFRNVPPVMSKELVDMACKAYFLQDESDA